MSAKRGTKKCSPVMEAEGERREKKRGKVRGKARGKARCKLMWGTV